jgi:GT2 family glycosyltransferase
MLVSFIISTHNRRDVLLKTLERVRDLGLSEATYEIHVIDNASRDGTADAVAWLDGICLHRERINRGSCAKNIAIPHSQGEFIVFLDDDSYPQPGSIERMIGHFQEHPRLGAASFTITLPDGSRECSAYPNVFIGCGVGLRRAAIDEVGGLPEDFFMQAEEYDLSLRLLSAGWDVATFDDLHVTHLKTPVSRTPRRVMRLDVRNNIVLVCRYFPSEWAAAFCFDWLKRYWITACANRQRRAFLIGLLQGAARALARGSRPVTQECFERFTKLEYLRNAMQEARDRHGASTVLFIDLGKNVLPYWLAAEACGLRIIAIADNRLASQKYRGIQVLADHEAQKLDFDIAIISNSSPVHAQQRAAAWRSIDARPVIDLLAADPSVAQPAASISAAA